MKKQLTKTEEQNTIELRRSVRNTAVNKLSTSRRRPKIAISPPEIHEPICPTPKTEDKRPKQDAVLSSPIKKQLPTIAESPCLTEKISYTVGQEKSSTPSATPKSSKTHSFVDSTPFKEDLLACSQHFDPQSDVAWDCRSPDAINFLKKGRRRRHYSDVSEIVTQLQISKEEFHEEPSNSTSPPLLGLWMNDGNYFNHPKPSEQKCKRERRRKDKARSNKGNDSLSKALLEKLQLVMEKCEENEEHVNEGTEKKDNRRRSASVGDESKDLFDITSTCKENDTWSDDELFEDDSFIIKATQMESKSKSFKRKIDGSMSEEPPVKSGKYCQSSNSKSNYVGVSVSRFTRLSSKPSPFKKHKSFNDRDEYKKSHLNKSNFVVQSGTNQMIDFHHTSSVKSEQVITDSSKRKNVPCAVASTKSSSASSISNILSSQSNALKSNSSTMNNIISNPKRCTVSSVNSSKDKSTINYSASKSSSSGHNSSNFVSKGFDHVSNLPSQTTKSSNVSKSSSVCNYQSSKTVTSSGTALSTGSRRSSGVFDTSLSDDILCQLVEPDEILDSQVPVCISDKSTDHIDEALSFFHHNPKSYSVISNKTVQTHNKSVDKNKFVTYNNSKTLNSENGSKTYKKNMAGTHKTNILKQYAANLPSQNVKHTHCSDGLKMVSDSTTNKTPVCLNISSSSVKKELKLYDNQTCSLEQTQINDKRKGSSNTVSVDNKCKKMDQNSDSFSKINVKKEPTEVHIPAKTYSFKSKTPRNEPNSSTRGEYAIENASEDLFMSDDDDLSEPQLLAMLDTVESTQMNSANISQVQKTEHRTYCLTVDDNGKQKQKRYSGEFENNMYTFTKPINPAQSTPADIPLCKSPFKCSPEDIEKKRQAALKIRQDQSETSLIYQSASTCQSQLEESQLKSTPIKPKSDVNVVKYSPEDIEKKRQAAIKRLQKKFYDQKDFHAASLHSPVKESSFKSTPPTPTKTDKSPFKCSPEDIERKKREALARRKLHMDKQTCSSQQEFNKNTDSDMKLDNNSPLKCSQEEIENKKLEAMKRLQKKSGKIFQHKKNDQFCKEGDLTSSKIPKNTSVESSPLKCSPEDVEMKRHEAVNQKQCSTNNNTSQNETSPFKCLPEDIERKKQEAIRRKKLHFEKNK